MKTTAKKSLSVLLSLLMVLSVFTGMTFTAGAANTYQISSYAELKAFAAAVNGGETDANAILTADIIAEGDDWTPIGDVTKPYIGTFDGDGHTITGLSTESNADRDYVGLFGCVDENGIVQNVGLVGGSIKGQFIVGAVAGYNKGKIINCYNTGTVRSTIHSSNVGGVVGQNYLGSVQNCYNTGTVSGEVANSGGVVGWNDEGTVQNCYNTGDVSGYNVGGIVGQSAASDNGSMEISSCFNTGTISGTGNIGGIVGFNYADGNSTVTVTNCYNIGAVSGNGYYVYVGGIMGSNSAVEDSTASITNCYSAGTVIANGFNPLTGGVIGRDFGSTVQNCYYDSDVCAANNGIGAALTTAQMTAGTYTDDDVTNMPGLSSEKWLVRQSNEFIAYYPHLKGFAYDITGAVKDWPAKLTLLSLDDAKVAAKEKLASYKNAAGYRPAEQAVLTKAIAAGNDAIDDAATVAEVVTALEGAKAEIDKIKTDAELSAEEAAAALAAAKAAAKAELANYKNADDYRDAQKNELAAAITAGNEAIDSAATVAEVEAALADAKAAIDKIKTDAELSAEETADDGPDVCEYCGETHDVNTITGFFTDMLHDMLYIVMRLARFFCYEIFVS